MSEFTIEIRLATDDDQDAISASFNQHFLENEPMNAYLKDYKPPHEEQYPAPNYGITFVAEAIYSSGEKKLAGFFICNIQKEPFVDEKVFDPKDNRAGYEVERLLAKLKGPFDVVKMYGVTAFELYILSVVPEFWGKSVGFQLCQYAMDYAIAKGYEVIFIDCSSGYTDVMARKLGMQCIGEVSYEEHLREIGEKLFKVKEPHTHLRRFVKLCNNFKLH